MKQSKVPDVLSERLRKDLSYKILSKICKDNTINAIDIAPEITNNLLEKVEIQNEFNKTTLHLDEAQRSDLVKKISNKFSEYSDVQLVLLCDDKLRLALYRLLVNYILSIVVISNAEAEQKDIYGINLKIVGTIQ